ncbi:MAG: hypothetical protein J7L66_04030 [Anaerolineaceae bacterium]|nr:hypothetical protein [Anaerolineaceae bacterium]
MSNISVGRLLRSNTRGCVIGCHINKASLNFGSLTNIPIDYGRIFGLVYDIHIDDDGLVRQLAAVGDIPPEIILDNRENRNMPVEMSILFVGYESGKKIFHLLPPHPPLSLDEMYVCDNDLMRTFTSSGHFGYLRHILDREDVPVGDLLSAHLQAANEAHQESGDIDWLNRAIQEIIILLRDNHDQLTNVLGAISDSFPPFS